MENMVVRCVVVLVLNSDASGQDTIYGPTVEGGEDGCW